MRALIPILLLFCFNTSFGQNGENKELLELSPFNLGDSIGKFRDSILCTDASKTRACEMYRYFPYREQPKLIAGVGFEEVKVFIGKKQVVKNIYFIKHYKGLDSAALNAEMKKDFKSLIKYFKRFYKPVKCTHWKKSKMYRMEWETYSWKMKNYGFSIQWESFGKREDHFEFLICILILGNKKLYE